MAQKQKCREPQLFVPLFCFTLLLLSFCFVLTLAKSSSRHNRELKELCPGERELCYEKAAIGDCFGSSVKATALMKQCRCSCETVHHRRIQNCCRTVGNQDMKFCLPLCGYNTTVRDLSGELGLKCVSQLHTWAYCAADGNDNSDCCKSRGVPNECMSFCRGNVPTCDLHTAIFSYHSCLAQLDTILKCQAESLIHEPRWDPNWKATCDLDALNAQLRSNMESLFKLPPLPQ